MIFQDWEDPPHVEKSSTMGSLNLWWLEHEASTWMSVLWFVVWEDGVGVPVCGLGVFVFGLFVFVTWKPGACLMDVCFLHLVMAWMGCFYGLGFLWILREGKCNWMPGIWSFVVSLQLWPIFEWWICVFGAKTSLIVPVHFSSPVWRCQTCIVLSLA